MKSLIMKFLAISMGLVGIVTFVNAIVLYWIPGWWPLSSFVAISIQMLAYIQKTYWMLLLTLMVCILLFSSAISVRKGKIVLPIVSTVYFVGEFIVILFLIFDSLHDGYWTTYIVYALVQVVLIVMLCLYFCSFCKKTKTNKSQM